MDGWLDALGQMPPEKALAWLVSTIVGAIVTAAIKAKADAKRHERDMQRVPPSLPPPAEPTPRSSEIDAEIERLRLALRREQWRAEEAERFGRELATEQARTAAALSAERAAHAETTRQLGLYRARVYELEDTQRAIDSGFTPLKIIPPKVIVEEDARPPDVRPTPKQGWPARWGKRRKPP